MKMDSNFQKAKFINALEFVETKWLLVEATCKRRIRASLQYNVTGFLNWRQEIANCLKLHHLKTFVSYSIRIPCPIWLQYNKCIPLEPQNYTVFKLHVFSFGGNATSGH